jgi:hypothetical protein
MGDINDTLRSKGAEAARARHDKAWARKANGKDRKLDRVHAVFRKWLGEDHDLTSLDAVLAVTAAAKLGGDPAWLLIIGGSGAAKTETAQSISKVADVHIVSTISSQGALLSAVSKKSKTKGATGGLLRKIGDHGILVIKDFTSIITIDRNIRASVLSALREIHDGRWDRNVGSDGGQTLSWQGHVVIVGACTTAWDQAHAVTASMGERFVLIRLNSSQDEGRIAAGKQAMKNTGREAEMREQMATAVAELISSMHPDFRELALQDADVTRLLRAANIATLARTGVETDYRGDIIDAHAQEMPTRFAKQLNQIMRGGIAIGMSRDTALALALRCARDSVPQLRLEVLRDLDKHNESSVSQVRIRLQKPWRTINRALEALHTLDLISVREEEDVEDGKSTLFYSLTERTQRGLKALI